MLNLNDLFLEFNDDLTLKKKYKDLKVQMILNAPTNPEERLRFEAELYAFQNQQVKDLTAIQKHGAIIVLHDTATEILENMKKKLH